MRGQPTGRRRDDSLRQKLLKFKNDHLGANDTTGSFPEKVRQDLEGELRTRPDKWPVLFYGRQAILEFFMTGVWRSNAGGVGNEDQEEEEGEERQLSFRFTFEGKRLPNDLTYDDPTAGRTKMRTVRIDCAEIWQWQKACELKRRKHVESGDALERDEAIGEKLRRLADGNVTAKIVDFCDRIEGAA